MADITELLINRNDFRQTKTVTTASCTLADSDVRVRIDKFGLTANNVSYAVSGDMIGYWQYYPARAPWGKVPVWGIGEVVESKAEHIAIGERLWGFFPMASDAVLRVGKVNDMSFVEDTPHRRELPRLYNHYTRTHKEPAMIQALEDARCILFPLFGTSYILYDYLVDNDFFGATQIVIGSVSSKTGMGLAQLLRQSQSGKRQIIGYTSSTNVDFVRSLGCCDDILTYDMANEIDATQKTAYIDMSGNANLRRILHHELGDNIVESCMVGATHWESRGAMEILPGAKPTFFFAPKQIEKRNMQWGSGVLLGKINQASIELTKLFSDRILFKNIKGACAAADGWNALLENKIPPAHGLIISM